jgi:hypothetical protein
MTADIATTAPGVRWGRCPDCRGRGCVFRGSAYRPAYVQCGRCCQPTKTKQPTTNKPDGIPGTASSPAHTAL